MLATPTLNADSGGQRGTFAGVWAGGPSVWTRVLSVNESIPDQKGTFAWSGLVATGLAGLVQNTISGNATYVLEAFVARTLTFPAFTANTSIGTNVVDFSKLVVATFPTAGNAVGVKQAIGTPPTSDTGKEGWYTTNVAQDEIIWLHTPSVNANSSGTATATGVQETV